MRAHLEQRHTPRWSAASEFVKSRYKKAYDAVIDPRPDYFLVIVDDHDAIQSCAGISFASGQALFSEHYLGEHCEQLISRLEKHPVHRDDIAEVGCVASTHTAAGRGLFNMLSVMGWCLGARYLLCTSNPRSIQVMMQCKVRFNPVCAARLEQVPQRPGIDWGRYYEDRPLTGYIKLNDITAHYRDTLLNTAFDLQGTRRSLAS